MFSFLKKKKTKSTTKEHLVSFKDKFSGKQKKAVMGSLWIIANSDGEFHLKEAQFLKQIASVLGYKPSKINLPKFVAQGPDEIFKKLESLDGAQKEWYIITAFAMIHVDGEALGVEYQYLEAYFEKMNVSREYFESVIKKSQTLVNEIVT